MRAPKTGGDIDAACSRCRLELAHVIVAMDGVRIMRVQCKTCGSVHAYRSSSAPTPSRRSSSSSSSSSASSPQAKAKSTSRAASRAAAAAELQYDDSLKGVDVSRARRYKPAIAFEADEVVDHPTFGLGLVTKMLEDRKIEVLFREGMKVLAHARE